MSEIATQPSFDLIHPWREPQARTAILCVDDEKVIRQSLKAQLNKHFQGRYSIETAGSGPEALEVIEELSEEGVEIAVLISDQTMPEMRGDELLQAVHGAHPNTSKILLTGQTNFDGVVNAINAGQLYRFIPKPWDTTDLNMTVDEAVKTFFQKRRLQEQNEMLQRLVDELRTTNESLEEMVAERTRELQQQKEEVEHKSQQITTSINYARRIQSAILPSKSRIAHVFPESFIIDRPRDIVSGDFYWMGQRNDKTLLMAADCTGHGVPGSMMAFMGGAFLNQIMISELKISPGRMLQQLDQYVRHAFAQDHAEHNSRNAHGMDCVLVLIDHTQRTLTYAGAMNPLYYVCNSTLHYFRGAKYSIGDPLRRGDTHKEFEEHTLSWAEAPVMIYMGSDGLQDQFGGEKTKKFTGKRLRQLLSEIHCLPMEEQQMELEYAFDMWRGDEQQTDDVLFMGLRIGPQTVAS